MSTPLPLKVTQITQDSPILKTYVFAHNLRSKPGQFIMVWLPGVDEVPMSIGWQTDTEFHVGIAKAGDCTQAIFDQVKVGDRLGIRGPYGTAFDYKDKKRVIVIGGGYGTPPLLNLAQKTTAAGIQTVAILGARSKDYVIYKKQFKDLGCEVHVSTDDGSEGHKGFCTDVLEKLLKTGDKADGIYTCGPEKMMVKVAKIAGEYGVDSQVSLERYMKCGFGACGQCCLDDSGLRVCKEGPVISGKMALEHPEFGKYMRTASGMVKPF